MCWSTTPGRRASAPVPSTAARAATFPDAQGVPQYCSPLSFTSDNLTNNELGWKTEFFDHRLQWNGAVYQENWKNVQVDFFDPGVLGNVGFGTNGPDYRIRGVETSLIAALTPRTDRAGRRVLEQQRADQLAVPDRQQSRPAERPGHCRRVRPADPQRARIPTAPRAARVPTRRRCSSTCACATSGRMESYNVVRAGGRARTRRIRSRSRAPTRRCRQGRNVSTTLLRFENPAYHAVRCLPSASHGCLDGRAVRRRT